MVGFLHPGSAEPNASLLAAFRKGLAETGYTEDRNVAIEFRWAHGDNNRLVEMAADLVQHQVAVIVTPIGTVTVLAAKKATTTIPIVFSAGTDPVKAGIVASLSRPGGNITGVNYMAAELSAKRLSLLHELIPSAARIALLVNPAPTVHFLREFAEIGGLMSYGASDFGRYHEVGVYTGRILKGEKPADMPVVQPTQFELVVNLSTARAIGITVPPSLLAQANEVIE